MGVLCGAQGALEFVATVAFATAAVALASAAIQDGDDARPPTPPTPLSWPASGLAHAPCPRLWAISLTPCSTSARACVLCAAGLQ